MRKSTLYGSEGARVIAFDRYIGKRVLLRHASIEIVRQEIRGQRLWLVGRNDVSGEEVLVSLRALLRNAARENLQLTLNSEAGSSSAQSPAPG